MESKSIIIAGPRGSGKSTLVAALAAEFPELRRVLSHTTRPPRPGENDGVDYRFVAPEKFAAMCDGNEFLFHRTLSGTQSSGLAKSEFIAAGMSIIDINGPVARLLRNAAVNDLGCSVFAVYVYADQTIRFQRILARDTRLSESDALRLMREDPDDGDVSHYSDFDLQIENNLASKDKVGEILESLLPAARAFLYHCR